MNFDGTNENFTKGGPQMAFFKKKTAEDRNDIFTADGEVDVNEVMRK